MKQRQCNERAHPQRQCWLHCKDNNQSTEIKLIEPVSPHLSAEQLMPSSCSMTLAKMSIRSSWTSTPLMHEMARVAVGTCPLSCEMIRGRN